MLLTSLPQSYLSFIHSLQRQPQITLQSLITNLIQEETFIKDTSSTFKNTSALYVEKRFNFQEKQKNQFYNKNFRRSLSSKKRLVAPNYLRRNTLQLKRNVFIVRNPNITLKIIELKLL